MSRKSRRRSKDLPGWATMTATSSDLQVSIERELKDAFGPNGFDDADPMLTLKIDLAESRLHPHDSRRDAAATLDIRASDLDRFVEELHEAIETARRCGVIPPPLPDDEYRRRLGVALGYLKGGV